MWVTPLLNVDKLMQSNNGSNQREKMVIVLCGDLFRTLSNFYEGFFLQKLLTAVFKVN